MVRPERFELPTSWFVVAPVGLYWLRLTSLELIFQ